jgi:hypothetical protein
MEPLLKPIASDILRKLFLSDDLMTDFIKNKDYASHPNVINVANVLLSYYIHMDKVNRWLSDYSMLVKNTTLSAEKKADITLRIQLLTYVSEQKKELDKVDTNKIIDSILQGKKRKTRRTKKSRRTKRSRQTKNSKRT